MLPIWKFQGVTRLWHSVQSVWAVMTLHDGCEEVAQIVISISQVNVNSVIALEGLVIRAKPNHYIHSFISKV